MSEEKINSEATEDGKMAASLMDLAEVGWGLIASAMDGGLTERKDWQDAAVRWRDAYHAALDAWLRRRAEPRSWSLPPEPGTEVTRLQDASGDEWMRRHDGDWDLNTYDAGGYEFDHANWLLLLTLGPLTDATPVAASPVSDKEGRSDGV